jgi:uncharacterized membrane protein YjjB (DUF3815 family)
MRRALLLGLAIWLQYALITVNFRAIARAKYHAAVLTDLAIACCGWSLFKLIASSSGLLEQTGYLLGAGMGSLTGIYLTRRWKETA